MTTLKMLKLPYN